MRQTRSRRRTFQPHVLPGLEGLESRLLLAATVIDLLVVYTGEAVTTAGGIVSLRNEIDAQVAATNQAFINTGLDMAVRLVAASPVNYTESGSLAKDWQRLSNPTDGFLDGVPALRTRVGADLVVLWDAETTPASTPGFFVEGEGSLLDNSYYGTAQQDQIAFIVVAGEAPFTDYVLAHEIGHTLGAAHAPGDGGGEGIAPDAHGYRFYGNDGIRYHDLMAYDPGRTILYYSNPDVFYKGVPVGNQTTANVARIMRMTAPSVSGYRTVRPFGAITAGDAAEISGWVIDGRHLDAGVQIRVDIDGVTQTTMTASEYSPVTMEQFGTEQHGFTYTMPSLLPGTHLVNVYAVDGGAGVPLLVASKKVTANHLVWTKPVKVTAGENFGSSLSVAVVDAAGQVATDYVGTVTLSIAAGPAGGTIVGTVTATVVDGVATFENVMLPKSGTYTLRATDGFLTSTAGGLVVAPDVSGAHLVRVSTPGGAVVGKNLPGVVFSILDPFGNVVTGEKSKVALTVVSGPEGGVIKGVTTVAAAGGKVTFNGVSFTEAGEYVIAVAPVAGATLPAGAAAEWTQTVALGTTTVRTPVVTAAGYAFGTVVTFSSVVASDAPLAVGWGSLPVLMIEGMEDGIVGTMTAAGAAKFVVAGLGAGAYVGTVEYPGDGRHTAGASAAFNFKINRAVTTTVLTTGGATGGAAVSGQGVTLTAVVGAKTGAGSARTGTVVFKDGEVVIGEVAVDGASTAVLPLAGPGIGVHRYTAVYGGDADFAGGVSAAKSVTVKKAKTSATVGTTAGVMVGVGVSFDVMVQVAVVLPAAGVPTGGVTFKDNGVVVGMAVLDGTGAATLAGVVYAGAGKHTWTVVYGGDLLDLGVTSVGLVVVG